MCGLQLVLRKAIKIGDTKYQIECSYHSLGVGAHVIIGRIKGIQLCLPIVIASQLQLS